MLSSRLEQAHTDLVLPKRGGAPPQLHLEAHDRAMGGFLEGIERQKPEGGGQRALRGARGALER